MIKKFFYIIILFSILSIFSYADYCDIPHNYTFCDDFNRSNSATIGNNWTEIEQGGTLEILNQEVKIIDVGLSQTQRLKRCFLMNCSDNFNLSVFNYAIKFQSTIHKNSLYFFDNDTIDTSVSNRTIEIRAVNNNLYSMNGTANLLLPIVNNVWYNVRLEDFNYDDKTLDIYVNNVSYADDDTWWNEVNKSFAKFIFSTSEQAVSQDIFIDNISYILQENIIPDNETVPDNETNDTTTTPTGQITVTSDISESILLFSLFILWIILVAFAVKLDNRSLLALSGIFGLSVSISIFIAGDFSKLFSAIFGLINAYFLISN